MKALIAFSLLLVFSFAISDPETYVSNGFQLKDHQFDAEYYHKMGIDKVESVVFFNNEVSEVKKKAKAYNTFLKYSDKKVVKDALLSCSKGSKPDFFKFALTHVGTFGPQNLSREVLISSPCFANTKMTYTKVDQQTVTVEIEASNPSSTFCSDFYLFGTTLNYHVENVFFHGKSVITFKNLKEEELRNIEKFGIHAFRLCDSVANLVPDVLYTLLLFLGGFGTNPNIPVFGSKPTFWMEMANEAFIKRATGYEWQKRDDKFVDLDESEIQSGDFIAVTRFDGIDQIIQYGAGSASGHSTVALRIDGVLHVLESQDGWYWPKHGIQRNTYKQWVEWAQNAGFNVAILPLSPEKRKIFNETAAYEWFKTVEGLPYGYHNFLFGWVDTPDQSYPPLLDPELVPVIFSILEKFLPNVVDTFLNQALNKRLKTENLTLAQISEVLSERNMTFPDLFAMVEEEGWAYKDGMSYVCSSFVIGLYKRAGLFEKIDPNTIHATEFTPRDIYQLNFFDSNYKKPAACQNTDPDLPYCQIMGKHKMILPGYNTLEPYEHMNERCASQPPDYIRTPERC